MSPDNKLPEAQSNEPERKRLFDKKRNRVFAGVGVTALGLGLTAGVAKMLDPDDDNPGHNPALSASPNFTPSPSPSNSKVTIPPIETPSSSASEQAGVQDPETGLYIDKIQKQGGSAGADAGGSVDAGMPPTFLVDFSAADEARFYSRADNGGTATFGAANASSADNAVAELVFKGSAALGPGDKLTPDFATEIGTNQVFGYGTFRTRVQLAQCSSSEELVNGVFTYFNDGKDHDGDGLIDNSEIDIEILCSDPSIISLTIWSEYTSDTAERGVSRVIHTKTGAYEDTLNDTTSLGSGTLPAFKLTGFPDPKTFYEMGFEWHATSLRYFIVVGGNEITLWTYTDATNIPSLPAAFLFNVWHSSDWWNAQGIADYPANDAVMRMDWFRYWKE